MEEAIPDFSTKKRRALLLSNSYTYNRANLTPLKSRDKDILLVAEKLQACGFDISSYAVNNTVVHMRHVTESFLTRLREDGEEEDVVTLFYFSGYATSGSYNLLANDGLSSYNLAKELIDPLALIGRGMHILLLDLCLTESQCTVSKPLPQRFYLLAATTTTTPQSNDDTNNTETDAEGKTASPFTDFYCDQINQHPGVFIEELSKKARLSLSSLSFNEQSTLLSSFCFL
jgi:hypothetical protein